MEVLSVVQSSVALPRTGYPKSAHTAHGLGGEALTGRHFNVMLPTSVVSRKLSGARSIAPRAVALLQTTPYVDPQRGGFFTRFIVGTYMPD